MIHPESVLFALSRSPPGIASTIMLPFIWRAWHHSQYPDTQPRKTIQSQCEPPLPMPISDPVDQDLLRLSVHSRKSRNVHLATMPTTAMNLLSLRLPDGKKGLGLSLPLMLRVLEELEMAMRLTGYLR